MDIDIDCKTDFDPCDIFENITRASMIQQHEIVKHPCGVYFQNIPIDPFTNLSAIPYKEAEQLGYTKIDFLHLSVLDNFKTKSEIRELIKIEPDWTLLRYPDVVEQLFHLSKWYDMLQILSPKSVEDLADCLALIRPGKQHLAQKYLDDKERVRRELYKVEKGDKYNFKKSHAVAYALVVVLQLHAIEAARYK